jgi:hypothetical protein
MFQAAAPGSRRVAVDAVTPEELAAAPEVKELAKAVKPQATAEQDAIVRSA